jgi:hypothetical protein
MPGRKTSEFNTEKDGSIETLQDWCGNAVQDYYIYATPTMFLVNDKKEIIAVPTNIEDIKKYFN